MKKIPIKSVLFAFSIATLVSCDTLQELASAAATGSTTTNPQSLSNADVISGLKEALMVGITNSVNMASLTDGFMQNASIRLPLPEDAKAVRDKAIEWGLSGQVEKFETTLNRAAEDATKAALPIFKQAILNMSIQDGFTLLNGGEGAATRFLKNATSSQLVAAFSPRVQESIAKVKLTEYWNPIITKYNGAMTFTGGQKLNPDLNAYVTEKAIEGLFKLVEIEENKIRKDPAARVTDLLQKVFGSIKK
ncbi:MAG: DUF4197 domain-containing protein [Crocinitomicaceae bacterium]|nr:DUF4197 domain-containing protein [Crocinitomicaceae bacterium]